ncbi:MAG: alpha/beta hydrolase [Candidatus Berkiella sp.]
MSLNPVISRLIQKAYKMGFADIHTFDEEKMRAFLTHPKFRTNSAPFVDYKTHQNVTLRCYTPICPLSNKALEEPMGVLIYLSATAFVLDRLDANNDYCSLLANTLQMKVINIQHGLAPEHKFPKFLDDCVDSIIWLIEESHRLAILPEKLVIWGESSGGSIAASCTHVLRDRGLDYIKHQTLFYPMVDLVNSYPSKEMFGFGYMLDKTFIHWLDERGFYPTQDRSHPLVSPLLSRNFNHLPPATIITAHYDPLRDEGELYAEKLKQANVPLHHKRFDDMIHGFMRFYGKVPTCHEAFTTACEQIKLCLSTPQ